MAYRISNMTRCTDRHIDFDSHYAGILPALINAIGIGVLDAGAMKLRQARQIAVDMPSECAWSLGYEDPRVFVYNGTAFIIAAHRDSRWVFCQSIIELTSDLTVARVVRVVPDFDLGSHQKNWNPFVVGNDLFFTASIVPHQVVSVDLASGRANLVHVDRNSLFEELTATHHLRGGSAYVQVEREMVGICRTALRQHPDANTNEYMCVAYAFHSTDPFEVTRRSQPFRLDGSNAASAPIQMLTGLVECGDDLLLTYGENDCEMKVTRVNRDSLLRLLG